MSRYAINKTKYLDDREQADLARVLTQPGATTIEERDKILLLLLLYTGGRASEVLALRIEDVNPNDQSVFIRGLKDSNDREIPLPVWLFRRLQDARSGVGAGQRLFPISYPRLRQIWEFYRPVKKKLHGLRHTFAINLYKRTRDLRLVQVALGHRNINNTIVYSEYVYNQEELRRLVVA